MTATLLPSSASPFERAAEASIAMDERVPSAMMRGAKLDAASPLLPWLIWEYGLGELLPYLPDPRQAIRDGVLWQRVRGTPAGLRIAFGWRGMAGVTVEEHGPGVHFADFMVDPGAVPDASAVLDLIALARLASPVRARLARIVHGYDVRKFRLDGSRLGNGLLSDYSGVAGPDGVRLSFGRVARESVALGAPLVEAALVPSRVTEARWTSSIVLDRSRLSGAKPHVWPLILHSHLFTIANAAVLLDPAGVTARHFIKALVVPSDGPRLGSINAAFAGRERRQVGVTAKLSGAQKLSGNRSTMVWVPIRERIKRVTGTPVDLTPWSDAIDGAPSRAALHEADNPAGDIAQAAGSGGRSSTEHTGRVAFTGQPWPETYWPRARWADVREVIGTAHTTT
ncbi:phage tail protein [Azospirillum doebereinerae]|uniref:phage tail protein n=1 Tax=Azospirillum doebereinerae TaxID=92933 RepID=UPI001EE58756|nr:phage tail protein [Azospirillum doebereinerae]MCG5240096.1 phage tail protein [Azospirillum doebereinerae]